MSASSNERLYTIGETVQLLQKTYPDVTHSSLRFLERGGFIRPHRTPGGHRLFSEADLDRIRTIKQWQEQNLSLEQIGERLERLDNMPDLQDLRSRFVDAAVQGNFIDATQMIRHADDVGMASRDIFEGVLTPAMIEIGDRWFAGELDVGREHEVSELSRDLISELTLRHIREPEDPFTVLAACVEGEFHELGLRMVTGLLRMHGIPVHFLGANVPTDDLVITVSIRKPDVVLLSATIDAHRPAVGRAIEALTKSDRVNPKPAIVVGGQAWHENGLEAGPNVRLLKERTLSAAVDEILSLRSAP